MNEEMRNNEFGFWAFVLLLGGGIVLIIISLTLTK